MTIGWSAIDAVLVLVLPALAWRMVTTPRLFEACVAFIAYGLLLAISWVRLGAIDVALAEAAIGAGFTGALLIRALAYLHADRDAELSPRPTRRSIAALRVVTCAALGLALFAVLHTLPAIEPPTGVQVRARVIESGVSNPVTAILLNFRAFDTLLEVGVMWLAVVAGWSLCARTPRPADAPSDALIDSAVARLVPPALLLGVYLWWIGGSRPGGAFQGAALLAGAAVMAIVARRAPWLARDRRPLRSVLAGGFAVFLVVAVATAFGGERVLLEYPARWAYPLILAVELVCMFSIGAGFGVLFAARRTA